MSSTKPTLTQKTKGYTMQIIENESIYCFDVDNTLVSERRSKKAPGDIKVENFYTKEAVFVKPHVGHVDLLKEMFGRGRHIVVWSAAGAKWAEAVVKALKLQDYVHVVQTKPHGYVDDQPIEKWLSNHIFLSPKERS